MLAKSASEDLFRHTLSRLPTQYGRLAYLASLRDSNTGVYKHHGLSASFGRDEAATALRESHEAIFTEWLNLDLRERYDDLLKYFASLEGSRAETIRLWLKTKIYLACVPSVASKAELELFSVDLEALLEALKHEGAGEQPGPASSPPE
jgi:hypothetical protein